MPLPPAKPSKKRSAPSAGILFLNGESGYNTAIRQVEKCSDALFELRAAIEYRETDRIAANIDRCLGKLIDTLDRQALKMLAPYDPYAKHCLVEKKKRDPRRDGKGPDILEGVALAVEAIPAELRRMAEDRQRKTEGRAEPRRKDKNRS